MTGMCDPDPLERLANFYFGTLREIKFEICFRMRQGNLRKVGKNGQILSRTKEMKIMKINSKAPNIIFFQKV